MILRDNMIIVYNTQLCIIILYYNTHILCVHII